MMRFWLFLRSVLAFVPLALVMWLTIRAQALWMTDNSLVAAGLYGAWFVLAVGWLTRLFQSRRRTQKLPLRALVCAAIAWEFAPTNASSRPLFYIHKPALQRALARPADKDGEVMDLSPIGTLKPRQISKSGQATCFWFWEDTRGLMSDDYEYGWAYCPGDSSCKSTGFEQDESPESHPPADENLGDDWYRVSRWLHH